MMSSSHLPEDILSGDDLALSLSFAHRCMGCEDVAGFHALVLDFAASLGFSFVLYGYTHACYNDRREAQVVNLSNPQPWAMEYEQENYLQHDPVVHEMELRIAGGENAGFFVWDAYTWPLSEKQHHVIARRRDWGLEFGCSVFADSQKKNFAFLISFADKHNVPDARIEAMTTLIIPQLLMTRKRLCMQELVNSLSEKEAQIALAMMDGETNRQIALALSVTENTVKFHIKNIFKKLRVTNRQQAMAVLLAERYMGL